MLKYINIKPFMQSGAEVHPGKSEITEAEYNAAPPEFQALYAPVNEANEQKSKSKKNDVKDISA